MQVIYTQGIVSSQERETGCSPDRDIPVHTMQKSNSSRLGQVGTNDEVIEADSRRRIDVSSRRVDDREVVH